MKEQENSSPLGRVLEIHAQGRQKQQLRFTFTLLLVTIVYLGIVLYTIVVSVFRQLPGSHDITILVTDWSKVLNGDYYYIRVYTGLTVELLSI